MSDAPRSPLPEDPRYWERLARRIHDDAATPLAAYGVGSQVWYGVLARRAPWLVAAAAAAMFVLWLVPAPVDAADGTAWIERELAPNETAGLLVGGPVPPTVEALLVQFPPDASAPR